MVFPKPTETAMLVVNGREFVEWETVMVRHALREQPPFHCRFTCSEGMPISRNFAKLQIKPGDDCAVFLAGHLAFSGKVETRQVYYDAERHHIEIQCATFVEVSTASVISKTMEWKDKSFKQIAEDVLGKLGIKLKFEGGEPPNYKFPRASAIPGEAVYDFLDNLARSLRSQDGQHPLQFTTNDAGDFVVAMGPNDKTDSVTEGKDILIGREVIYNPSMAGSLPAATQGTGNDQAWGPKVAHMPFSQQRADELVIPSTSPPALIRHEMASSDKSVLTGRAEVEDGLLSNDQVTVFATVYGWLAPSGGLWRRNQVVNVDSPMLLLHGDPLRAKAVVFTQDNQTGTRTLLELANEAAIGRLNPSATS